MLRTWWRRFLNRRSARRRARSEYRPWRRFHRFDFDRLEDRLSPATHSWTGGGGLASPNWSDPANWTGGAPAVGEEGPVILNFPTGVSQRMSVDDITDLRVDQINLTGSDYTISGAAT